MKLTTKQKVIGIGGAALLLGGTGLYFYKKNQGKVKVIKDIKNFNKSTVGTINVIETAQQLGMDLGTAYGWWSPQNWTENDTAVRDTLLKFPKELMPQLMSEYNKKYSRNLQVDCQKLLPESYYAQIRTKFL